LATGEPVPDRFLEQLEGFFDWFAADRPARRQRAAALLRELDPGTGTLPAPIESLRVEEWRECTTFFVRAAHHGPCTEEEFRQWLDVFERFLLDRLVPRTFDNADQLDALIEEGEANG
jgi:hypothetical protein